MRREALRRWEALRLDPTQANGECCPSDLKVPVFSLALKAASRASHASASDSTAGSAAGPILDGPNVDGSADMRVDELPSVGPAGPDRIRTVDEVNLQSRTRVTCFRIDFAL